MAEKNNKTVSTSAFSSVSRYICDETVQWIAAIPLITVGLIPLMVFLLRLDSMRFCYPSDFFGPLRGIFFIFAGITAFCCIYIAVMDKQKPAGIIRGNIPMLIFAGFLLLMLISYLAVGKPVYDDPFNELGINPFEGHPMYISFFAVYFFCGSRIRSYRVKSTIIRLHAVVALFIAAASLVDYYFMPLEPFRHFEIWDGCMPGIFNNPNHYGYYLTIMTMLSTGMFLYEKSRGWRIFGLVSAVIHCAVMVLNDTFGSYLAVWFGFVFIIIANLIVNKKFPLKVLIPAAAFLLFSLVLTTWQGSMADNFAALSSDTADIVSGSENAGNAGTVRWTLWVTSVEGIMDSPVFGQGVEGWDDILLERSRTGIHAHNEYLQYALFFGIPAAVTYIAGIVAVFIRGLKNRKKLDGFTLMALAAAFAYCVSAFFGNPKYYTAPFFFIILGLAYNYCTEDQPSTANS